ncbi:MULTISPECIES: hypothetical protein [Bradyrhizobium]|uniref:hypothetical protein n=1 Tax=Bradyrhizobium TaxID=374 RepID=UPI0004B11480|nr:MULTISPECIES: hypothetical protein [unclassified Bradyrhizobium]
MRAYGEDSDNDGFRILAGFCVLNSRLIRIKSASDDAGGEPHGLARGLLSP